MPITEDVTSRLGHMLVAEGLVSKKQIDDLLESVPEAVLSRKRPGEIFLEKGLVGEENLTRLMGTLYNLPVMPSTRSHPARDPPLDSRGAGPPAPDDSSSRETS
jgi:hypothetical protein